MDWLRVVSVRSQSNNPLQVISDFTDSVSSVVCTPSEIIARFVACRSVYRLEPVSCMSMDFLSCVDGCVRIFDLRAGKLRKDLVHRKAFRFLPFVLP
jgi:hypothetical protein